MPLLAVRGALDTANRGTYAAPMATVVSVNVGRAEPTVHSAVDVTGIDKRPVMTAVEVRAPGSKRDGLGSGLVGDMVCSRRHHGGDDQAVYAYAREDLDTWAAALGRSLGNGCFGENLTTAQVDITGAVIGERWRIGDALVLEVSSPRIPCNTFAGWLGEHDWIGTFTRAARPGAYLRVIEPGQVQHGDSILVVRRPEHEVTIGLVFRALTLEPLLLERVLAANALPGGDQPAARRRLEQALRTATRTQ